MTMLGKPRAVGLSNHAYGIVKWLWTEESIPDVVREHGSVENYCLVKWFVTARTAAEVHDYFEGRGC